MPTSPANRTVCTMAESAPGRRERAMQVGTDDGIRDALEGAFRSISERAAGYGPEFSLFVDAAFDSLCGGKLLRPTVLMEARDALMGNTAHGRAAALEIAAAIEFLHFSFLLHDDVIDGDLFRRGRLNFIGSAYASRRPGARILAAETGNLDPGLLHWARSGGILMGDLLLSRAHQIIARQDLPHPVRLRLLEVLEHSVTESVAGEFLDVGLGDAVIAPDLDTAMAMSRLKTAAYTFELPLRAACILAGLPREVEGDVGNVGRQLGTVFQLQDDYLSTFGDAGEHGKDTYSDLREGKETTIIAFARTTDAWPAISEHFGDKQLSMDTAGRIRELLIRCGAETYSRSLIDHRLDLCAAQIDELEDSLPAPMTALLVRLTESLAGRRS
ncbi:polyprenyl synthetase family protein [Corynebacterium pacaense]|uniref:polyprenyl synthetase family protein n=1 Tax=Corynebacterium pacaense TaxID=1816684 RepID=UPI001FEB944A|nr:polyprenyl synthetase family protein [Corynebacterium pacaense]